jgi:hypothetical protein
MLSCCWRCLCHGGGKNPLQHREALPWSVVSHGWPRLATSEEEDPVIVTTVHRRRCWECCFRVLDCGTRHNFGGREAKI